MRKLSEKRQGFSQLGLLHTNPHFCIFVFSHHFFLDLPWLQKKYFFVGYISNEKRMQKHENPKTYLHSAWFVELTQFWFANKLTIISFTSSINEHHQLLIKNPFQFTLSDSSCRDEFDRTCVIERRYRQLSKKPAICVENHIARRKKSFLY